MTVKTLAHVWASEEEALQAQAQIDAAQGLPSGDTTHYQSVQGQDGFWWMMANGVTTSVIGMQNLQVINERVEDEI